MLLRAELKADLAVPSYHEYPRACEACKVSLSSQAEKCPQCGHPNKKVVKRFGCLQIIGILVAFIVLLVIFFGGDEKEIAKEMESIDKQVANGAIAQHQIAKNQGDETQICVQADMVSAAYLQVKDEANYRKWKAIGERDCEAAEKR